MKARTFGRHVRESLKSLKRNGWMTFASVSAVTVTLLLVGVFFMIMMNLSGLADSIENNVEIKVTLEPATSEENIVALKEQIEEMKQVDSLEHSTKEEELDRLIGVLGKGMGLYKSSNPLGDAFYVKVKDPQQIAKVAQTLKEYDYVEDSVYGEGTVEKLFNVLTTSRNIGAVLIVGLLVTAMFLISNTIRLTINSRGSEIEIMKLVGATNSFVRIPFVLEGVWLGLIGSIIPVIGLSIGYTRFYNTFSPRLENEIMQLLAPSPFLFQINFLVILIGVGIGVWGSFVSVRKFLNV
ncbi:FtsX-like permease family protein [Planococcaceae bacterium Storch 2/2-2]|nr:FtsX-like permease family protein [Planococcaceae bacterium Storch 2/2-2]